MENQNTTRRPNVVFIFADQMRAHVLGCYGNKIVPTPNIDAMASAGTVLDNMVSTYPVCSPYRAMLLSGRQPMANGTVSNDTGMRDDIPTIGTAFKAQGYETGYIGKWHLEWNRKPFVPKERRQGFDYWAVHNCSHKYMDSFYCTDTPEEIHFKGYDAIVQTNLAVGLHWAAQGTTILPARVLGTATRPVQHGSRPCPLLIVLCDTNALFLPVMHQSLSCRQVDDPDAALCGQSRHPSVNSCGAINEAKPYY